MRFPRKGQVEICPGRLTVVVDSLQIENKHDHDLLLLLSTPSAITTHSSNFHVLGQPIQQPSAT
jgi:hypothetical protein